MAMANYDEVTHSNVSNTDWNTLDPMFRWDTHFPERITRMNLTADFPQSPGRSRQRRGRNRNAARFKTQPITFDEIKEVDEEGVEENKNKEGLKSQFAAFSRSMDGLVPTIAGGKTSTTPSANVSVPESTNTTTTTTTAPVERTEESRPDNRPPEQRSVAPTEPTKSGLLRDGATIGQLQHDCARARRKKRLQRRSIEEEPEIESLVAS